MSAQLPGKTSPRHRKSVAASTVVTPVFAQPQPSPDPQGFKDPVTDQSDKELTALEPIPVSRGTTTEPTLTLAEVLGSRGDSTEQAIVSAGQLVFHSVGDTGNATGPASQSLVADKMVSDFTEANPVDVPAFFFNLGDLVYYFGEATYYYDQFYEPYRNYPAPILAVAGNHDGVLYSGDSARTLEAFLRNLCAATPAPSPDAGGPVAYDHDSAWRLLHI